MGLLGRNVQRALEIFPKEDVHVVVFDDLRDRPRETYLRVLDFLGLPDDGRQDFGAANVTKEHGSGLGRLAMALPHPVVKLIRKLGLRDRGLLGGLSGKFAKKAKRQPLSPELRQELHGYYREDVELLSRLLQRDLSGWLDSREPERATASVGP
jgi:hypothetical protein